MDRQECSIIWCLLGIRQIHGVSSKHQTEGSKPTASPYVDHAAAITKGIADSYTTQYPADGFDCSGSPEGSDQLKLCGHKLVVTGRDPIPVEINKRIVVRRCDLNAVQEETDVIMSRQMIAISEELDGAGIRVMFDDTDFFVLLLHVYRLTAPKLQ